MAETTGLPTYADLLGTLNGQLPTTRQLKEHFAPTFARIAEGAKQREADHQLAYEPIELLRTAGLTRIQLDRDHGGAGATLQQLADLLIDLAAADNNLPQALHAHYMYTHLHLNGPQGEISRWWLAEAAAGKIFGNALVELPPVTGYRPVEWTDTTDGDGVIAHISGDKFYCTGAVFADYLLVSAQQPGVEGQTFVVVDATEEGVERVDDWNGFGQRLTASGSTILNNVPVRQNRTFNGAVPQLPLGFPLLWLTLVVSQVGIGRAALADVTEYVRGRKRTYEHAKAETPAEDPLVQEVVGNVSAKVSSARHIALGVAGQLEEAYQQIQGETSLESPVFEAAHTEINVAMAEACVVVNDLILDATNQIFEAGGASAVDASKMYHQHWLNARTIGNHTPLIYRSRLVGDYRINGTVPPLKSSAKNSPENTKNTENTENAEKTMTAELTKDESQ